MLTLLTLYICTLQLQMEKLASRHAITELMSWISLMENIIQEDQNKILEAVGSEVVQTYIQKYKVAEKDMRKTSHTHTTHTHSELNIEIQLTDECITFGPDAESKSIDMSDCSQIWTNRINSLLNKFFFTSLLIYFFSFLLFLLSHFFLVFISLLF